jgi:outer membrane lipoprotein SlyB
LDVRNGELTPRTRGPSVAAFVGAVASAVAAVTTPAARNVAAARRRVGVEEITRFDQGNYQRDPRTPDKTSSTS